MGAYPDPNGATTGTIDNSNSGGWWSDNGMLISNASTRIAECADGTSNAVMVGEQSGKVGDSDIRNGYYTPWGGVTISRPISGEPAGSDMWGMGLSCVAYADNSRTAAAGSSQSYHGNTTLNSFHSGGINVLMGDGAGATSLPYGAAASGAWWGGSESGSAP